MTELISMLPDDQHLIYPNVSPYLLNRRRVTVQASCVGCGRKISKNDLQIQVQPEKRLLKAALNLGDIIVSPGDS